MRNCEGCKQSMNPVEPREVNDDGTVWHVYCSWKAELDKRNKEAEALGEINPLSYGDES